MSDEVTIISPIFDEKNHTAEMINAVENVPLDEEIIVVNDYSSDVAGNSAPKMVFRQFGV